LSSIFTEALPPEIFDGGNPLLEGNSGNVAAVQLLRFSEALCGANDTPDHG
jgi:hypothetical protein